LRGDLSGFATAATGLRRCALEIMQLPVVGGTGAYERATGTVTVRDVRSGTGGMADPDALSELTARERATVKTHVGNLLMKLRFRDRVQLVIAAYESALIRTGDL